MDLPLGPNTHTQDFGSGGGWDGTTSVAVRLHDAAAVYAERRGRVGHAANRRLRKRNAFVRSIT